MILLSGDKIECSLALIALTFAAFLAVFDSIIWIVTISLIYLSGVLWGTKGLKWLGLNLTKLSDVVDDVKIDEESCGVCGGNSCKRHKPSINYLRLNVPKDFDDALENLLEQLLQSYVSVWYSEFSSDEAFVQQFRTSIATAVGNVAQRLFRVDVAAVIFEHLVPVAIQHAKDWRVLEEKANIHGGKPIDYARDYLGPRIHPAAYSREAELNYLRGLVTTLMPHLLPTTHFSVNNKIILREILANWVLLPAMDALANPDNINTLVVLSTHHEGTLAESKDSVNVPLLHSWAMPPLVIDKSDNCLKPNLEEVLNNPELLYLFMQHIKETGPVNLLQFCLEIDDLSKRMLNPDMSVETEENLYRDAKNLYMAYLTPDTPSYLHLPLHISKGLKKILDGGPGKIQELRTSRPLYQAHQEAHTLLETMCLPSFHHSYQMYTMLCGPQTPATPPKTVNQISNQSGTAGMGSRLSSQIGRIQRVLRTSAVDGAPYQSDAVYQAEEVDCSPRPDRTHTDEGGSRDLTTWRVTVPDVDGRGAQPVYTIVVHGAAEDKSWTVYRRDVDFYSLRNRLAEFHGDRELNDSPLPARKNQHSSLNSNRLKYQDFLQKLLLKPKLRSSELLHNFLTASDLESNYSNYSAPDIGLLYQNVAQKLRKERGQHLDKFMKTFLRSINIKYEHTDVGVEPCSEQGFNVSAKKGRDLVNIGPFQNNLNITENKGDFQFVITQPPPQHVKGASFCIAEAVDSLLQVPQSLSRVYWLAASLSYQSLDPIVNKILNDTLVKLLSGGRAAIVVKLLHNAIFGTKIVEREDADDKREQAQDGLNSIVPWWILGLHSTWKRLMKSLLDPLQNPQLNKHLAYLLVDQIVADLFPDIASAQ